MGMLANIRNEYNLGELNEKNFHSNPLVDVKLWLEEAIRLNVYEPTAIHLATVSQNNIPDCRVVLLKDLNESGLSFFTNYSSKKGEDIANNPHVSVNLFWKELERQIRIQGVAKKLSEKESSEYFDSRPIDSRIGAITSPQSKVIPNREYIEEAFAQNQKEFSTKTIQRPDYWGGYFIEITYVEFWQGRKSRLHDRLAFQKNADSSWTKSRLAP